MFFFLLLPLLYLPIALFHSHNCTICLGKCHDNTIDVVVYVVRIAMLSLDYFSLCQFAFVQVMYNNYFFSRNCYNYKGNCSNCSYKLTLLVDEDKVSAKVALTDRTECNECSLIHTSNRKLHQ